MYPIQIDLRSRTPIFEQIIEAVERAVLRGWWEPNAQLPSVRALSAELGINPNTIQKAYAELEKRGVIYSLTARGSFVAENIDSLRARERTQTMARAKEALTAMAEQGASLAEAQALLREIWKETAHD